MNKFLYCITILIILINSASAETINEAFKKAYNYSFDIKAQRENLKSAKLQKTKAVLGFMPKVSGSLSRNHLERKDDANPKVQGTYNNRKLTVTQNVFNGGASISNFNINDIRLKLSELRLKGTEQVVLYTAAQSYIGVILANESYKIAENNEQILRKHLESTKLRFELGEVTKTDVAQADARYSLAQAQLIRYKGEIENAKSNYIKLMGELPVTSLSKPHQLKNIPESLEEAIYIGKENSFELRMSELSMKEANEGIKLAWSKILPSVDLQGEVSKTGRSAITNDRFDKSAYISLTIPLFQGGGEYIDVKDSSVQKEKAKYTYHKTLDDLVARINNSWIKYNSTKATIKSAQDAVDSALLAFNGVEEEAKIGLKTSLDILNAEQEVFDAKLKLLNAEYQTILAGYELLAIIGKLNTDS
ncbi:MAG: TolC family outer membrane protein [Sphingobacteriia bacterium]|nr:TolC family outer membrane protein [Sphingobacteriia bacterium]